MLCPEEEGPHDHNPWHVETMTEKTRGAGPLSRTYDEALALAASIHREQQRKGSHVAYLSHLITVSALVLEDDGTEDQAIAGLLHDAIEDGPQYAGEEIERRFGAGVRAIVAACSDGLPGERDDQPWRDRKQAYVRHLEHTHPSALVVTAADKLHNLRCTLDDLHMAQRAGQAVAWPKSNECVHLNLWYYATVLDVLQRRILSSRSCVALERVLNEVCSLLHTEPPAATSSCPTCTLCERGAP